MEPMEWRWGSDITMELVKEIGGAKTEQAVSTAILWRSYSEDLQDELRAGDECKVM